MDTLAFKLDREQKQGQRRVNVNDDDLMVELGLRKPKFVVANFRKTKEEKEKVKEAKAVTKVKFQSAFTKPAIFGKLVIHRANLKHDNKFKTTFHNPNISDKDIIHYINAHNIELDTITKIYFRNQPYKL